MANYQNKRIIFLGTPDFAVASLDALIQNNFNVVAVVTAPDKPAGRGMALQQSAVKQYAIQKNIPVLQPEKLKDEVFLAQIKSFNADIQVVVAFRMLPEVLWNMPPLGTINVHGSLLPDYRGAAPINWAIINGETETGVTCFQLKHEIDTGDMLLKRSIAILPEDDFGSVYNKLKIEGGLALVETLKALFDNKLKPQPQILNAHPKHAPKIFTEHCLIDFSKKANDIVNLIRGLSPIPAAYCFLGNKKIKVFKAVAELVNDEQKQGSYIINNQAELKFKCTDGYVKILELQMEGKKRMPIADFLRGYKA